MKTNTANRILCAILVLMVSAATMALNPDDKNKKANAAMSNLRKAKNASASVEDQIKKNLSSENFAEKAKNMKIGGLDAKVAANKLLSGEEVKSVKISNVDFKQLQLQINKKNTTLKNKQAKREGVEEKRKQLSDELKTQKGEYKNLLRQFDQIVAQNNISSYKASTLVEDNTDISSSSDYPEEAKQILNAAKAAKKGIDKTTAEKQQADEEAADLDAEIEQLLADLADLQERCADKCETK